VKMLSSSSSSLGVQPQTMASTRRRQSPLRVQSLFGFGRESESAKAKRIEKEEQYRTQQELLQRRRSGAWKQVRRKTFFFFRFATPLSKPRPRPSAERKFLSSPRLLSHPTSFLRSRKRTLTEQEVDTRRAKVSKYLRDPTFKKQIDEERRERLRKEAEKEPVRTGFRIIVPVNPIGIPEYETERFDLRLPYVDNGWVDEDADFFKQIGRIFGGGKKSNDDSDDDGRRKGKK